ncbi:MAG: N-acetyltransferase family protein [Pseudomonadota bacterium]
MLTIRDADESDAETCAEIYAPFVLDTWISFETKPPTAKDMAQRIQDAHVWLVAEDPENRTVGFAYASPHRIRAAYASSVDVTVYVDPTNARTGAGRELYERLLKTAKIKGFHAAFAGIARPNEPSEAFHEAMGFQPVGIYREVGWKRGGWRDVGWWQRLL